MAETKFTQLYEVTPDGRIFSIAHNWCGYGRREMRQSPNGHGYPSVRLSVNGTRKRITVHRLVAEKFLPARPTIHHEIRHLDGDKTNNTVANLKWGTRSENAHARNKKEGLGRYAK